MSAKQRAGEHHLSAANHHALAAQYHRESSRHYQLGKDYAHAAHKALVAIGHAWQAIDLAKQANQFYTDEYADALQKYMEPIPRFLERPFETAGTIQTTSSCAEHHARAADHHEQAAKHHSQAAKHCDEMNYPSAVHEARSAHGHAHQSIFHGIEAAKYHADRLGESPTDHRELATEIGSGNTET